jgi:hypothetical protein
MQRQLVAPYLSTHAKATRLGGLFTCILGIYAARAPRVQYAARAARVLLAHLRACKQRNRYKKKNIKTKALVVACY